MTAKRLTLLGMALSLAALLLWPTILAGAAAETRAEPTAMAVTEAAQDRWYAVVGFWNNTDRATIQYYFRWGDREERSFTLRPGERRWHAWQFARPNQSTWPYGYVRYDVDGRTGYQEWTTIRVHADPSRERGYWHGSRYAFSLSEGGYRLELRRVFDDPAPRE